MTQYQSQQQPQHQAQHQVRHQPYAPHRYGPVQHPSQPIPATPYGYVQQPWSAPASAQPASNGLATGGFVVALVGAVLAFVPLLGVVAWVICPIGLVLSIVGLTVAVKRGAGRGLAIAGVVLGAAGLLVCFLWLASFAAATSTPSTGTYGTSYSSSY